MATLVNMKKNDLLELVQEMQNDRDEMEATIAELQANDRETQSVEAALDTIADHFHIDARVWDRDLGCEVAGNLLAYTQSQVLNGICWKVWSQIEQTGEKHAEALYKARMAQREFDGSEVAMQGLERALEWVERFAIQKATLEDFYVRARDVHFAKTGKPFVEPKSKQNTTKAPDARLAQVKARAAALLGGEALDENAIPNTDGVSDGHAV